MTKDETAVARCKSVFGSRVTITQNTLNHILAGHPEVAVLGEPISLIGDCIENPVLIAKGRVDELVALRPLESMQRFLAVFYIENGRVITAFVTSKPQSFMRRGIVWKK